MLATPFTLENKQHLLVMAFNKPGLTPLGASSSFCWIYRVPYWSLRHKEALDIQLQLIVKQVLTTVLSSSLTTSFLKSFANIANTPPYLSKKKQKPSVPWQILQPGFPGPKCHRSTSWIQKSNQTTESTWSTSSKGTSLSCLRTLQHFNSRIQDTQDSYPKNTWNEFNEVFSLVFQLWFSGVAPPVHCLVELGAQGLIIFHSCSRFLLSRISRRPIGGYEHINCG